MPDSPVASAPSQNAASSQSVVSATVVSVPSAVLNGSRGVHSPRTSVSSNSSRTRSPSVLSTPHAKHVREIGSGCAAAALRAPFSTTLPTDPAAKGFTRVAPGDAQKQRVSKRARSAAVSIRRRRDTGIDEDAGVVAENERVRRLRAPVGEGEGHADGDSLSVDATDVARTGQARERVEGREDRAP